MGLCVGMGAVSVVLMVVVGACPWISTEGGNKVGMAVGDVVMVGKHATASIEKSGPSRRLRLRFMTNETGIIRDTASLIMTGLVSCH